MLPNPLAQPWLRGALISVVAALLGISGLCLQKLAQLRVCKRAAANGRAGRVGAGQPPAPWCQLLRSSYWWYGLLLFVGHHPVNFFALTFTPETTVLPLAAVEVVVNFTLAYGLLNERFTGRDMWASSACVVGLVVAIVAMPRSVPGYMGDFPTDLLSEFCGSLFSNLGFAIYLLAWPALLAVCAYATAFGTVLKPFASPVLVGLFASQFHFAMKLLTTLASGGEPLPGGLQATYLVGFVTAFLGVASVAATCEGLRHLDCRFFVPATTSAITVMIALEDLVFFRQWEQMTHFDLVCFTCGCCVSVLGAVLVPPASQRGLVRTGSLTAAPLLSLEEIPDLQQHEGVLAIMEEHRLIQPQPVSVRPLEVIDLHSPEKGFWAFLRVIWKWVPITLCFGVLALVAGLYEGDYKFVAFSILTAWGVYNGWKYGLHMALFSYAGQRKMAQYDKCDFQALHRAQLEQRARDCLPESPGPKWEDVRHFVMLPNYKEDVEVLRLAIRSVAVSGLAAKQIGIVLAMEAREPGAEAKALGLLKEFQGCFRYCVATYHPAGIPGETPGKSANVKWAANQVLEYEVPKLGLDLGSIVLTVADADSEFHRQYFEALTYQFVHAGCGEGETPSRYLSIWQPPILHYKNYHTQPVIVRLASLFSSQHELANLADPNAVRVPYSTYSISATLASAVKGWDPDWISEDWHMGMKCFLATAGRVRITPIFLGVMNYAPEGETYLQTIEARWTQAKRHALGFSELVFFQDHFPRVFLSIDSKWKRAVFLWKGFFLWSRCLLIHLSMATVLATGPINAVIILWFLKHRVLEDVNSWTFLTYVVFQSTVIVSNVLFMFTNVLLYELARPRIDGHSDATIGGLVRNRWLHFIWVACTSMALMPFFFFAGGLAEWIAAMKTARTHRFQYEVAMKPNLSQPGMAPGATLTCPEAAEPRKLSDAIEGA